MKPRIVILSAFLSPFRSGAEACAEEVPLRLTDRFDFTIVTARLRRDLPVHSLLQETVPVIRVGIGHPIDKWLFPFLAPFAVRRLHPDVIHAVLESYAGMALVFCRLLCPRARTVLTCQSTNTSLFLPFMHRCAHRVTVISSVLVERAKSFGRSDVSLIPNGIPLQAIIHACEAVAKVPSRILFVGRLERVKGVDVLLASLAELKVKSEKWEARIVGDGSQREALEDLAKQLGIADRVTFAGFVSVPAVYDEFAAAEIFVGLSRSEALGNVFLEAQAAGCAVIAARVGGIPDVVTDGETGILIAPDDPVSAANVLGSLLKDRAAREKLAANGTSHARKFDWSAIAERYAKVYEELL